VTTMRNLRLLVESLQAIAKSAALRWARAPAFAATVEPRSMSSPSAMRRRSSPASPLSSSSRKGWDERAARERQAAFYQRRDPEGGLSLILGAGNVASIPPMDALYKMFVDGNVCILKMTRSTSTLGPIFERAFTPFIDRDYLRVTYGAGDVGKYLSEHPDVDDIHITGSNFTHDLIVWGPPGPERDRRIAENDPVLKKTITSELGNVSPVAIVPGPYTDAELWFVASNVASMVQNNGSFNCNAAKVIIVGEKWPQREAFRVLLRKAFSEMPLRKAYYPGAKDRYTKLLAGRTYETFGTATDQAARLGLRPGGRFGQPRREAVPGGALLRDAHRDLAPRERCGRLPGSGHSVHE